MPFLLSVPYQFYLHTHSKTLFVIDKPVVKQRRTQEKNATVQTNKRLQSQWTFFRLWRIVCKTIKMLAWQKKAYHNRTLRFSQGRHCSSSSWISKVFFCEISFAPYSLEECLKNRSKDINLEKKNPISLKETFNCILKYKFSCNLPFSAFPDILKYSLKNLQRRLRFFIMAKATFGKKIIWNYWSSWKLES